MTELTLFAIFGVPLLLLIMGGGVALWVRYGDRDDNGRRPAHGHPTDQFRSRASRITPPRAFGATLPL